MSIIFGAESEFVSANAVYFPDIAVFDESKFVVIYSDTAGVRGRAKIGTVSGTNVTFGSMTEFNAPVTEYNSVDIFSTSGFVNVYRDNGDSGHGTARVGTVSGTTITFGAESEFVSTGSVTYCSIGFLNSSGFVVAYRDDADSNYGKVKVGTVSGTTITFGSGIEFGESGSVHDVCIAIINEFEFVVAYGDINSDGRARIGTVSGTNVTFGGSAEWTEGTMDRISVTVLDESKFVVAYRDTTIGSFGRSNLGTISGTTITFGEHEPFEFGGYPARTSLCTISATRFIVSYADSDDSFYGKAIIGDIVGGDDIVYGDTVTFLAGLPWEISNATLSAGKFIVGYPDDTDSSHGTVKIGTLPVLYTASGDLFISSSESVSTSGDLFIHGYNINNASGDLFISGPVLISTSGDLFINVHNIIQNSGNLFIHGHTNHTASGNLFVCGHIDYTASGNLYLGGHEFIASIDETRPSNISFGDEEEFLSANGSLYNSIGMLSESKFVVAYQDNSDSKHGTVKIGTVSGTTVTFGTETEYISANGYNNNVHIAILNESTFVVVYQDESDSGHGTARVGTVVDTSVTFGAAVEFNSAGRAAQIAVTPLGTSSFVVGYADWSDSKRGKVKVGTVDGTNITFGGSTTFHSLGEPISISMANFDSSKFVIGYRESAGGGNHGTTQIGTVSGTSVTFGAETEFISSPSANPASISIDILDSSRFVLAYIDTTDSNHGTSVIGTVNGTSIIFGAEIKFLSADGSLGNIVKVLDQSNFVVIYEDGSDSNHGTAKVGMVNDTDIIFSNEGEFLTLPNGPNYIALTILNTDKFVVAYTDTSDSNHGTVKVGTIDWNPIGSLFIHGHTNYTASGNLFINGHNDYTTSGDLFTYGLDNISGSISLLVFAPPPNLFDVTNLYITGPSLSGVIDTTIDWLLKSSDHNPQIIGTLEGATTVNIQLWEITNGQNAPVFITSSGCYQIGNTGRWGWSTINLPTYSSYQRQYFYNMIADNNETFIGQFFLELPESAKWIYPSSRSDYLL